VSDIRALLLTDVVDSTAIAERLGDETAAALWAAHDRLARDLLQVWRGLEIDRTDGFLLLFDSAADALGYAIAYHRALRTLPVPVQARAGLHVGPVILRRNAAADVARGAKPIEVEGVAKPTAARVMSAARGGQTLLSAGARTAIGTTAWRVQSHGHWRIKGVAEPIELFEAGDDDAPFAPPPDGAKAWRVFLRGDLWLPVREVRHGLPAERDAFVGREEPLRELGRRFDAGARLVSVLGMGGSGKTRLATRYAWTWLGDFAGGAWFCDLSQARSAEGIVSAVAHGLDVPLGRGDPVARLGAAIAGRGRCLVVLDNFEQVARHAEETLGRWLDVAPQACFLVTTREILGLPGEEAFALAPLSGGEAAELFLRRARAARRDLALTSDDEAAIGPLMRLLDGLPLAIELAAARVRVMPPRTLLARMSERFRLLASASGRRDRQATLRATFDWSWDLLSSADKLALAQLSVFEGGFTLEAAETVLDLSACDDAPWPADAVHSLVDKSFVRAQPQARFDLLVSVQEYAAEQFAAPGRFPGSGSTGVDAVRARHCAHFASLGERRAIADRCADLDNLLAACRHAVARGDVARVAGALEGSWAALQLRGPFSAGVDLSAAVLAMADLPAATRARAEEVAGHSLDKAGDPELAAQHFEAALALARECGQKGAEARACNGLGNADLNRGRFDEARAQYERSLAIAREIADRSIECAALNGLGNLDDSLGRVDDARTRWEAALELARVTGDRRWEGSVLGNLGGIQMAAGTATHALAHYEASLAIAREIGDRQREGNALCNIGWLNYLLGQLDVARDHLESALTVAREIGSLRLECIARGNIAVAEEAAGNAALAAELFASTLALAHRLGDRRSEGQFLTYLGLLHARQRRFAEAGQCLAASESLLEEVRDRASLGVLRCAQAESHALAAAPELAQLELLEAERIAATAASGAGIELAKSLARVRGLLQPPRRD
jgi:predicted ATPase/class 3 adenylate cyclase/Tfp pilus assembly protein PilF